MTRQGSWASLPPEIRLQTLDSLPEGGRAQYAQVCEEWRDVIGRSIFRRLTLSQECLPRFTQLHRAGTRRLIQHVCLRIRLATYKCPACDSPENDQTYRRNNTTVLDAIWNLFSFLGSWAMTDTTDKGITVEIDMYSPSDSKHRFRNYTFGDNDPDLSRIRTSRRHGWVNSRQISARHNTSLLRLFDYVRLRTTKEHSNLEELPTNQVVTQITIRRQTRRRFTTLVIATLFQKCTRLEHIHYENWRYWNTAGQDEADEEVESKILSRLSPHLRILSLFEDFNEDYPYSDAEIGRITNPSLGAALAQASLGLENLSTSFNVDAESFFRAIQPSWNWDRLETLTLTSRLLTSSNLNTQAAIAGMLCSAGAAALRMPHLRVMEIWSGCRGAAHLFRYEKESCSIVWKGTRKLALNPKVLHVWETVTLTKTGRKPRFDSQIMDVTIDSHGSAIHHLGLCPLVIHPNSLRQIQREINSSTLFW